NFVFSSATNTCPVRTMPGLAIVGICPSSKVVSGDTFGFTVCITNIGNVSLTNITITNCVGSGTPQASSCAQLTTISRLDPNQSASVSRTEGPVFDGVSSVPNFGTASARDVCGNPVS